LARDALADSPQAQSLVFHGVQAPRPTTVESACARILELETQLRIREIEALRASLRAERAEAQLIGTVQFSAKPFVYKGRIVQLASKAELADALGASESKVDEWTAQGVLPQPFDPPSTSIGQERKSKAGRKHLRWDFYECWERYQRFRRVA
jgi:hypothetical protein